MNYLKKIKESLKEKGLFQTIKWLYNSILYKIRMRKNQIKDFKNRKIKNSEKKYVIRKESPNVFIIASIPYYDIGGGQRCSQFAKTFNKMGFNVIYLYAYKSNESEVFKLSMPMTSHLFIKDKTISYIKEIVKENDLFIFESPSPLFKEILELAKKANCKIVYENIDNWETSLGSEIFNEEVLKEMLKSAHLLVGTAKPLVKQLEDYTKKYNLKDKKIMYLANAVDDELFCGLKDYAKPEDLVTDKKTFLYYGSLWGEWFDWDLIIDFANNNPRYSINIIGDYSHIPNIVKCCPHNVHFLGLKRQIDLPAYLKYVDYALIPFKPGKIGDYVSPLKIFEYISMYKKVLCTNLPDVVGYPNVYLGDTVSEWEKIILKDDDVNKDAADEFILDNTWSSRISYLIDYIYPDLKKSIFKDNLSIIILNYNNKNVIFKSINTILKFNDYYHAEIVVVDNGSTDGSFEELEKKYKDKITLVKNTKNGCSSGRNLGVKYANKKYLLFLDSDQWITNKYYLLPYENILKIKKDVGAVGWAAGFFDEYQEAYHVVDSFEFRYVKPNILARSDISYLGSGGMLVLKEDFLAVNGFDENYDPTCYEDTDFTLTIRNTGKEIYYSPYLGIIHLPHQTTKSGSDNHQKLLDEKKKYFKQKWLKKNSSLLKKHIKRR